MKQIFFIVEGWTEEVFYRRSFSEYFSSTHYFSVVVMPNKKNTSARKHKGGSINYIDCINNIKRFLAGATHCEKVILIYDYYGLHKSFTDHLTPTHNTLDKRIEAIQQRLESDIKNPRFKFTLQVHEFEAYLFSNPQVIADHFNDIGSLSDLNKILAGANNNPELINNSEITAPSKRLETLYPSYQKVSDGISIIDKIGIQTVRDNCNYFNSFCSSL